MPVREQDLAFLGKITASMTHELNNVLGIIRESAGLMEDFLAFGSQDSFPHREKFLKSIAGIQGQVRRGVELITRLNRFAHSMDEPRGAVEVNELLEQTAFLMQRFARNRGVQLKVHPAADGPAVATDPFHLQMVLAAMIEYFLERAEKGQVVALIPRRQAQGVWIQVQPQSEGAAPEGEAPLSREGPLPEKFAGLAEVLADLEGRLFFPGASPEEGLLLTLPA